MIEKLSQPHARPDGRADGRTDRQATRVSSAAAGNGRVLAPRADELSTTEIAITKGWPCQKMSNGVNLLLLLLAPLPPSPTSR